MKDSMDKKRRIELVAKAHHLKPVVMIGQKGLTDNVMAEVDQALNAHELIKIKISAEDKTERQAMMDEICEKLDAIPLSLMGSVAIVFRKNPD